MRDWYQIHLPYAFERQLDYRERSAKRKERIAQIPREVYKKKYRTEAAAVAALKKIGENPSEWEICECGYL